MEREGFGRKPAIHRFLRRSQELVRPTPSSTSPFVGCETRRCDVHEPWRTNELGTVHVSRTIRRAGRVRFGRFPFGSIRSDRIDRNERFGGERSNRDRPRTGRNPPRTTPGTTGATGQEGWADRETTTSNRSCRDVGGYEDNDFQDFRHCIDALKENPDERIPEAWRSYTKITQAGSFAQETLEVNDDVTLRARRLENASWRLWGQDSADGQLDVNELEKNVERKLGFDVSHFKRNMSVEDLLDADFAESIERERLDSYGSSPRTTSAPHSPPDAFLMPIPELASRKSIVFGHSLERNGANNFLLYLLRELKLISNLECEMYVPKDGPMAADYEKLGIKVNVLNPNAEDYKDKIQEAMPNFDVAIVNTIMGPEAVLAADKAGVPSVWVIHEAWPQDQFEYYAKEVFLMAHLDADKIRRAFAVADRICFPAKVQRKCYEGLFEPHRGVVIYNGIPTMAIDVFKSSAPRGEVRKELGYDSDDLVILHLGTVCKRKAQLDTMKAFVQFCKNAPEKASKAKLLLVGARYIRQHEIEYIDSIKKLVVDNNLQNQVTILDTKKNVLPFYLAADIVVCPSINEVLPLVICEAMAFQRPVIASAIDGIPEALKHGREGFLIKPGDIDAFAGHLEELTDRSLRSQMGRCGRLRVREQFSFDRMLATYAKMVQEAVDQRSAPELQVHQGVGTNSKPVILLDMDNTIVDWDSEFQARWRKRNGSHANRYPELVVNRQNFEIELNFAEKYRDDVLSVVAEPGFYKNLHPIPGAVEAVYEMVALGCEVRFCTSTHYVCPGQSAEEKFEWVREHLGEEYVNKLIITSDKTAVKGDILVDDKPVITGCVEDPDWIHVVYDQSYNSKVDKPRLQSWYDWRSVIEPLLRKRDAQ
uniref:Glycosyl transferase family 1 domain-containing protein n=1 Tax=Picocystis salinarum TaxID=88271 RepID=A0A7S3UEC2_9CHLO